MLIKDEKYLSIHIHYYDQRTPEDYEPPLFRPATMEEMKIDFDEKPLRVELGTAETPYHKYKNLNLLNVKQGFSEY